MTEIKFDNIVCVMILVFHNNFHYVSWKQRRWRQEKWKTGKRASQRPPGSNKGHQEPETQPNQSEGQKNGKGFG